jgi:hypothetical protein
MDYIYVLLIAHMFIGLVQIMFDMILVVKKAKIANC